MRKLTLTLTRRNDGRVCKRLNGTLRIWPDEESARKEILGLIALREASPAAASASVAEPPKLATIRTVLNLFLQDRQKRMEDGRIKRGTYLDYDDAVVSFAAAVDAWPGADMLTALRRDCPVSILSPDHFRHVRAHQARGVGAYMLERRIQGCRTAFKWGVDFGRLIPFLPHYGDAYHKPGKAEKRGERRTAEGTRGESRFTVAELASLIGANLKPSLQAMLWLGLNGGMLSVDCALLRWPDIKREGRFTTIDTYREKTGIRQKFVLWKETIQALESWRAVRPKPKGATPADLVFVTAAGNPWRSEGLVKNAKGEITGGGITDSIRQDFWRAMRTLGIHRVGVGFGKLRHSHISAAARHPDANARKVLRGHRIDGIEEHYDFQDLDRLKSVGDVVYQTLVKPALKFVRGLKSKRPKPERPKTPRRRPASTSRA